MNKGVWYALVLTVCYGAAVVNDVGIINRYDPVSYVAVMSFLPGAIIALIFPGHLRNIATLLRPKPFKHMILYSFFYALGAVTFYMALSNGATVSQLSPISRASIIMTVLLGAIFLKERKDLKRKIVCAILVSAGVLLLG